MQKIEEIVNAHSTPVKDLLIQMVDRINEIIRKINNYADTN